MKRYLLVLLALVLFAGQADAQSAIAGNGNRIFIPATAFHHLGGGAATAVVSMHGTPAAMAEISTFGIGGWLMSTADAVSMYMVYPADKINNLYPLAVRIWWTATSAVDAGGIDWLFDMEEKSLGGEDALEAATVALADAIVFAADSTEVQFGVQTTDWDTISSAALNTYHQDCLIEIQVELNSTVSGVLNLGADEVSFLGVELLGVPKDYKQSNFNVQGSTQHGASTGIVLPKRFGY